jgi:DNA-binding NtrC family response regulator
MCGSSLLSIVLCPTIGRGVARRSVLPSEYLHHRTSPLRNRPEDLPLLVTHFIREFNRGARQEERRGHGLRLFRGFASSQMAGNVRELHNVIQRAVIRCRSPMLSAETSRWSPSHFVASVSALPCSAWFVGLRGRTRAGCANPRIHERNKKRASDILGMSRRDLYNRFYRCEIRDKRTCISMGIFTNGRDGTSCIKGLASR